MLRFWDSSALVPLLVEEESTDSVLEIYASEEGPLTWWASEVECASALARLERSDDLEPKETRLAFERLSALSRGWHLIAPGDAIKETAKRLLRVHPLRAADALQLAAAITAAEGRPKSLELVSLDDRLTLAAEREGFPVLGGDAR